MKDERFDEVLQEMRDESASPEQVKTAQDRVWHKLASARPMACTDFSSDLAGYTSGELNESRRLLIEDHLSRCVDCRHALAEIKGEGKVVAMPTAPPRRLPTWTRWAVAAGVALAVLYLGRGALDTALAPSGPGATVVSVSGTLYEPSGAKLDHDAEVAQGAVVRTAAGSHAVLQLRDGSQVEMNQRTELSVLSAYSGDTIRLERGDIVVDAEEQGRDRLRVVTRDSIASVRGTVFAVSSGTFGSLVSVVEGSVEVSQTGFEEVLVAGEQAASTPALQQVSIVQAVSWSQEANDYYELIAELARIEEHLAASTASMREDSSLVDYLPTHASAYFAIPNLEGTMSEAISLLDQRAPQSAALNEWWTSESGVEMRTALEQLQSVATLLGEELVLVMTGSEVPTPLFLAKVVPGQHEELQARLQEMADESGDVGPFQVTEDLFLASDNSANLAMLSAQLGDGAGTPFAAEIKQHYARGVGWLAAIDVGVFNAAVIEDEISQVLGLSSMRYLFLEQRSSAMGDESEATLSFSGTREGMASWLAAPGSIGSAEYISSEVIAASAGSTRSPAEALDQLLSALGPDSELMRGFEEIEAESGINVRDDVAASLGSDFVIALEGVSLGAEPEVVFVAEVLNGGALDAAIDRLITVVNREKAESAEFQLTTAEQNINGRDWKSVSQEGTETALWWTYDHGYLVASTNLGAAQRAISVRDSALSLVRTSKFQQQFPTGGDIHNSGFFWLDLGRFTEVLEALGKEGFGLGNGTDPVLIVVTGDADSIRWASRARLTSLIFNFLLI